MILDQQRVQDITQGNSKLLISLSQLFLGELPAMITDIETAYYQSDRQGTARAVHRLKSAVGNFVTSTYYQEVSQLEIALTGNKDSAITLSDWLIEWNKAKLKLETMTVELQEMAGI